VARVSSVWRFEFIQSDVCIIRVDLEHACMLMCCSVLQCVAVCCSVLQCVAVFCSGSRSCIHEVWMDYV